jgi:hypothetical protein
VKRIKAKSPSLFLIEEERACRAVAMNVVATTQRTDLPIAKKSRTRVRTKDLLEQAGIVTLAAK